MIHLRRFEFDTMSEIFKLLSAMRFYFLKKLDTASGNIGSFTKTLPRIMVVLVSTKYEFLKNEY